MEVQDRADLLAGLVQELRRGTVVLSVLSQLQRPTYGYNLVQEFSQSGIPVEANTLYPLLRRLEKQGLVASRWETGGSKPRKYYVISEDGQEIYRQLRRHWLDTVDCMARLLEPSDPDGPQDQEREDERHE